MARGKHAGGRPSKIESVDKDLVLFLASKGFTNEEIAKACKIATSTFSKYLAENEKFSDAVKRGREIADSEIVKSLYQAAKGYSHPEDKIFCPKFGDPVIVPTVKHYAPDTVAAIFWLCNRQKQDWKHVQRIEHTGENGKPIKSEVQIMDLKNLSSQELAKLANMAVPEDVE